MELIAYWPPTFAVDKIAPGVNARHNPFFIRIRRDARHFQAVRAQEVYEWGVMNQIGLVTALIALGVVLLTFSPEIRWFFAPFLTLLGLFVPRFVPALRREMELRGHMIEVLVAESVYGANFDRTLDEEAKALARYKEFGGWSVDRVRGEMLAREAKIEGWAGDWAEDHA